MTEQGEVEVVTSAEEPKRSNAGLIALIIILVVVFCCCGFILVFYFWLGDLILNLFSDIFYLPVFNL